MLNRRFIVMGALSAGALSGAYVAMPGPRFGSATGFRGVLAPKAPVQAQHDAPVRFLSKDAEFALFASFDQVKA